MLHEIRMIARDLRKGVLPVRELPRFLFWLLLKKSPAPPKEVNHAAWTLPNR